MNITYTPAGKNTPHNSRMDNYDAAVSRNPSQTMNASYRNSPASPQHRDRSVFNYDSEEVGYLVSKRFWSVLISLFVISVVTAWVYTVQVGANLDFSSVFIGTTLITIPVSFIHANYFRRKISN